MVQFGDFHLNRRERQLVGPGGPVELTGRAFDLLAAFLEAPDRLLDKDALFAAAWPGMIVEDNTLQVHISALRKALGPGFITTVHGRGYKYVGPSPVPGDDAAAVAPAAPARLGNIERYRADCIAREAEAAAVTALIEQHRLVSIVGPGGVGKTTLAVSVARALPPPPGGVWMLDMASLDDGSFIASTLIQTLGVPFRAGQNSGESIAAHLRRAAPVLVFDNCEHVRAEAASIIRDLLADVPGLTILTTSQVPLGLAEERVFKLLPFALDADGRQDAASARYLAYCYGLFGEQLAASDLPAVMRLCRRLDGVALAIKMAAARAATLGLDTVDRQLEHQLAGLDAEWDTALPRHRSLLASLAWSYDLLDRGEQEVLRTLSVFQGSFSLEAVAAIAGGGAEARVAELVRRSLVVRDGTDRGRYRLLDSTRRFALERLAAEGEEAAARAAHAAFLTTLFEESIVRWDDTPDDLWRARYSRDGDNLRAALAWTRTAGAGLGYVALAANAWRYFVVEQLGDEALATVEAALPLAGDAPPELTARLGQALGEVCRFNAMDIRARQALLPTLAWFRTSSDAVRYRQVLLLLTWGTIFFRPEGEADPLVEEVRRLLPTMPASKTKAWALVAAAVDMWTSGDTEGGLARAQAGLAMHADMGNPIGRFRSVMNFGEVLHRGGDTARSIALVGGALPDLRRSGLTLQLANHLTNLAVYKFSLDDAAGGAAALLEAAPYLVRDASYWHMCALQAAAEWRLYTGNPRDAALLLGIIDRRISEWPDGRQSTEAIQRVRLIARLTDQLGQAELDRLLRQGAALSLLEADQLSGLFSAPPAGPA
ncbi:MAG: winged helix-turn-helix domain-containing protein [Devosia sp.]